jgi:hypothetical protein
MPITRDINKIKFPDNHGYLCGHGVRFEKDENNWLSMFEDESHNCIDIKGFFNGQHVWEQYFYWDYEPEDFFVLEEQGDSSYDKIRKKCQKAAEDDFMSIIKEM